MREREDANRTKEAGNRDEVEGVVANTLNLFRQGAVGFIDWLDRFRQANHRFGLIGAFHVNCNLRDGIPSEVVRGKM